MLELTLKFSSSWTNVLADETKQSLFTSSTAFNAGLRGLTPVALVHPQEKNTSRVANARALNLANPNMSFRVPQNYDNTVKGVLSRLLGEVRRLDALEPEHFLHDVFKHTTYTTDIESEHDELVSLATPPNEVQSSGAGLLKSGNPLYDGGALAKQLFGHLGCSIEQLIAGEAPANPWTPSNPSELIVRLDGLKEAQGRLIEQAKEDLKEEHAAELEGLKSAEIKEVVAKYYESPAKQFAQVVTSRLAAAAPDIETKDPDSWNWAGAWLAMQIHTLPADQKEQLIAANVLSRAGNLSGLAMSGNLGNITAKDLYQGSGCKKKYSTRMPFSAELYFETGTDKAGKPARRSFNLGVIKKTGKVTIQIAVPTEKALELKHMIEQAAVGPIHFGKKGTAFLSNCTVKACPLTQIH